jgi:hypothetical protein
MERNNEQERRPQSGGSLSGETRGMDERFDDVDLDAAKDVGSDPPGGLGLDIGGGTEGLGQDDPDRGDRVGG